jgi:hypothetical protein
MEKEFDEFFEHLEKISNANERDIKNVLKPLKYLLWMEWLKKALKIALIFAAICFAIYYIDTLNWHFCAIGRIFMLKILPVWNWKYLAKSKCLISKVEKSSSTNSNNNDIDKFNVKDCQVCEYFGR